MVDLCQAVTKGWTAFDVKVDGVQVDHSSGREEAGNGSFSSRSGYSVGGEGFDPENWRKGGVCNTVPTQKCTDNSKKKIWEQAECERSSLK